VVVTGLRQVALIGVGDVEVKTVHLAALTNYCVYLLYGLCTHWHICMDIHKTRQAMYV
jgi:hypothetical protein